MNTLIDKIKIKNENILFLYISAFFSNMYFDRAIWMIYVLQRDISISDAGLLESALHLSILFFEIPTGIVADIYGKKISIMLSRIFVIIYALGMIFSKSFFPFLFVFILMGISTTLESGSDIALLYDSIICDKDNNKEKQSIKVNSLYGGISTAGMAIGLILGGFAGIISWKLMYIGFIVMQCISILFLIFVKDKKNNNKDSNSSNFNFFSNVLELSKNTVKIYKNRSFLLLTLGIIFFTASINAFYIFIPVWFKEIGYSTSFISTVFAIDAIVGSFAYLNAYKIEKKIPLNRLIYILPLTALLGLISLAFSKKSLVLILFVIINNTCMCFYPLSNTLINERINSKERATILSTVSSLNSILMTILFPIVGFLAKNTSIKFAIFSFALYPVLSMILLFISNVIHKKQVLKEGFKYEKIIL